MAKAIRRFYVTTEVRISEKVLDDPPLRIVSNSVALDTPLSIEEIGKLNLHILCQEGLEDLQKEAIDLIKGEVEEKASPDPEMCAWCKKEEATNSICPKCWRRLG